MHVLIKEWSLDWHRPESQSQLSLCSLYTSFWNLWISGGSAAYVGERPSELTVVKLGLIQWFSSNIGEFCDNTWIIVFFQGNKNQRLYFEILLQKKKKRKKENPPLESLLVHLPVPRNEIMTAGVGWELHASQRALHELSYSILRATLKGSPSALSMQ